MSKLVCEEAGARNSVTERDQVGRYKRHGCESVCAEGREFRGTSRSGSCLWKAWGAKSGSLDGTPASNRQDKYVGKRRKTRYFRGESVPQKAEKKWKNAPS